MYRVDKKHTRDLLSWYWSKALSKILLAQIRVIKSIAHWYFFCSQNKT